jgi:hypothetical protein
MKFWEAMNEDRLCIKKRLPTVVEWSESYQVSAVKFKQGVRALGADAFLDCTNL